LAFEVIFVVLPEMEAAPINPSDIAFIRGGYNIQKSLPAIPGFEGTGTIAGVGGQVDDKLIGILNVENIVKKK
jgi:NADPH:quinone reductase-like Zn-dependent oxidoreductase